MKGYIFCAIFAALCCGCQHDGSTTAAPQHPRRRAVSPEVVIASNYDDPNAPNATATAGNLNWHAATFKPVIPPEATSYSVTAATLYFGKTPTATGSAGWQIQVRKLDATGKPASNTDPTAVIDKVTIAAADLPVVPSGQFPSQVTVTFPNAVNIDRANGVAVDIAPHNFSPAGVVGVQSGGTQSPPDLGYYISTTGGSIWSVGSGRKLLCEVKGTYTTP